MDTISTSIERSFVSLHTVVTFQVLKYLPLRDRLTFAKVCLEWRSFIRHAAHLWKNVSIDWSSPFGGEWKPTNELVNAGYFIVQSDPASQYGKNWVGKPELIRDIEHYQSDYERQQGAMEAFTLDLATTTDLTEEFSIFTATNECNIPPKSIHTLLMKQKRITSLNFCLNEWNERHQCLKYPALDKESYGGSPEHYLLEVIGKHQSTLKYLKLPTNHHITLNKWTKLLNAAKFPSLRSISFSGFYDCGDEDLDFSDWNSPTEYFCKAANSFIYQVLKHGRVEEINMSVYDFQPTDKFRWPVATLQSLRSAVEGGLTPYLKKVHLNCMLRPSDISSDQITDILMKNCPNLTHLCGFIPDGGYSVDSQPIALKSPFP